MANSYNSSNRMIKEMKIDSLLQKMKWLEEEITNNKESGH
jgi:hypothetical protein